VACYRFSSRGLAPEFFPTTWDALNQGSAKKSESKPSQYKAAASRRSPKRPAASGVGCGIHVDRSLAFPASHAELAEVVLEV
jgi:hypothetical protein